MLIVSVNMYIPIYDKGRCGYLPNIYYGVGTSSWQWIKKEFTILTSFLGLVCYIPKYIYLDALNSLSLSIRYVLYNLTEVLTWLLEIFESISEFGTIYIGILLCYITNVPKKKWANRIVNSLYYNSVNNRKHVLVLWYAT